MSNTILVLTDMRPVRPVMYGSATHNGDGEPERINPPKVRTLYAAPGPESFCRCPLFEQFPEQLVRVRVTVLLRTSPLTEVLSHTLLSSMPNTSTTVIFVVHVCVAVPTIITILRAFVLALSMRDWHLSILFFALPARMVSPFFWTTGQNEKEAPCL
jgi:hypothetical protein